MLKPDPLGFIGPVNESPPSTTGRASRLRTINAGPNNLREIASFKVKNSIDDARIPV